jgi:hypothetical protein
MTDKSNFSLLRLIEDFKFINIKTGLFSKFAKLDKSEMNINDLNRFQKIYLYTDIFQMQLVT